MRSFLFLLALLAFLALLLLVLDGPSIIEIIDNPKF
jgi:hypothetical protein